jgi:general secretion pathway protein A
VGKSALIKRFMHELSRPQFEPVYLHLTHLPAAGLLKLLVAKLGEVPRRGKDRLFEQILEKARRLEGALVVILDEAHLLDADALTDIRLLISSALDDTPPLKLVLVGQEPLRNTLRQSQHTALLNRIAVRHHLAPFTKPETANYIDFQVQRAGGSDKLFEPAAKDLIHDYSGGIPRQINNLATACLLQAMAEKAARVNEAIIRQTMNEFQLP